MSTQIGFDLSGLTGAIEGCDLNYQVALYADNAEVRVIDPDPDRADRLYQGKPAIRDWLEQTGSQRLSHRVVDLAADGDRVWLTDHCRYPDGRNLVYEITAHHHRGQITQQTVTLAWEDVRDRADAGAATSRS